MNARLAISVLCLTTSSRLALAQSEPRRVTSTVTNAQLSTKRDSVSAGIRDNSFLIEEAYNQEAGVVQHISVFQVDRRSKSYSFQFTQEWPLGGIRHQLSYSVPLVRESREAGAGIGDIRLNYRYQLVGSGDALIALAPRLTAIIPSGDSQKGHGAGAPGVEIWLPLSIVASDLLAVHANAGFTVTPRARGPNETRATSHAFTLGGSAVWMVRPAFNVMVENNYQRSSDFDDAGRLKNASAFTVSPGLRWAHNFPSGLQIVPGAAVPITMAEGTRHHSVLLYLSFEHRFTPAARRRVHSER